MDTAAAGADAGAAGGSDTAGAAAGQQEPQDTGEEQTGAAAGGQQAAAGQGSGDVMNGWKQYEANCSRCHGQDALGSALAPDLRKSVGVVTHEVFVQVVISGRPEKGMPPFKDLLDGQKVEDIYAYVSARSSGKLGPGRPSS